MVPARAPAWDALVNEWWKGRELEEVDGYLPVRLACKGSPLSLSLCLDETEGILHRVE